MRRSSVALLFSGPEPEYSTAILKKRVRRNCHSGTRKRAAFETREGASLAVQPVDSHLRAHPDITGAVLVDRVDAGPIQTPRVTRVVPELSECPGRGVEAVQATIVGSEPHGARAVTVDRTDIVVAEAARVVRIAPPRAELQAGRRETVDPAGFRADPKAALAIHGQGLDLIGAQAETIRRVVAENRMRPGRGVEYLQPITLAQPDYAVCAGENRIGLCGEVFSIGRGPAPCEDAGNGIEKISAAFGGCQPEVPRAVLRDRPDAEG